MQTMTLRVFYYSFIPLLYFIDLSVCMSDSAKLPPHYRISEYIFQRYNHDLVPKKFQNESVKVQFSMELYQIIEVNEPQQYLMLNAWIIERWVDRLLYWDPALFDNVTEIMVPHHKLFLPDTTLYNSLVMEDRDTRRLLSAKLTATKDGAYVELLYPTIYKLSCNLDLRYLLHTLKGTGFFLCIACKLIFGSWTFDNTYIDYFAFNESHAIGTANCIENEGWNVLGTSVSRRVENYDCCPNNYTMLDFYLHVQRKPLYYVINLITPTSIITLISIVGFFSSSSINEMREEKISLGITTLLSMSILIFMVSDKMPSTSSFIPLIGWFYTCMILLISVSTLASSLVIYVQKQGILGTPPSKGTMRWARVVGKFIRMELPLLMKQAYAAKAREDRLRNRTKRKESLWQKMYKLSKMAAVPVTNFGSSASASAPRTITTELSDDVLQNHQNNHSNQGKKSLTISHDVLKINLDSMNGSVSEYVPMQDTEQEDNTSYIDEEKYADEFPPSKFLHKTSTCQSFDSIIRNGVDTTTPRTAQRNLAELEFDWLAAVIERVCLIVFIIFFILMSFGINSIGLYYWWMARIDGGFK